MTIAFDSSPHHPLRPIAPGPDWEDADLLDLFLGLGRDERRARFADTAQTAEMVGVSRRTIQQWIDTGLIRAVAVGHKYQVLLDSVHCYLKVCAHQRI